MNKVHHNYIVIFVNQDFALPPTTRPGEGVGKFRI